MSKDAVQRYVLKIWTSKPSIQPSTAEEIRHQLPADYVQFIAKTNGGSAKFPKIHFELWSPSELAILNDRYQINDRLGSQFLAIGSDGGPICFLLDFRSPEKVTVGSVNFGDLDPHEVQTQAESFDDLLERMLSGEIDDDDL